MKADSEFIYCSTPVTVNELLQRNTVAKSTHRSNAFARILSQVLKKISSFNEPKIYQERDRSGKIFWRVFDPIDGQSAYLSSEGEVRSWLEQRYYH